MRLILDAQLPLRSFEDTNSRISFQSVMYHGVENLLELVGVVTRASDKKYLPRFFRVRMTMQSMRIDSEHK